MPNDINARAWATDSLIAHLSQRFNYHETSSADGGITKVTVQVRVTERMAKGRMEVRQRAGEIEARAATEIGAKLAKDGAAEVGEKETEAKEESREISKEKVGKRSGEEGHE